MIGDAVREVTFSHREKLSDKLLFPYPHPKSSGLILDPNEQATVREVVPRSPAAKAGFMPGDEIRKLDGQPLLSIADVQWVLNSASPDGAQLKAEVNRKLKAVTLTVSLAKGWRERDDISWRASAWTLRRKALGGMLLEPLTDKERADLSLPRESTALMVKHVGEYAPHNIAHRAGIRKGDVVVGVDSRTDLPRETDAIAYSLRAKQPGDDLSLTVLRNGARQTITFTIPQ
jgi:S1-C subfamily serine protease